MKSLILKDLYNISHNAKQMIFLLLFFAICFIPTTGANGYVIMCSIMCAMMTVTTFSFDEHAKWDKYAMIMPISRRDYVRAKYVVNAIFALCGAVFGVLFSILFSYICKNIIGMENVVATNSLEILVCGAVGFLMALFFGSFFIGFLIKFGAEKARMIMIGVVAVPCLIFVIVEKALENAGIQITEQIIEHTLIFSPFFIVLIMIATYEWSLHSFMKKEL